MNRKKKVSRKEMGKVIQLILDEPYKDYPEPIEDNCFEYLTDFLHELGHEVEEKK